MKTVGLVLILMYIFHLSPQTAAMTCENAVSGNSNFRYSSARRLAWDKTVRFLTFGFAGKPPVLQGVKTKGVYWGPHSLRSVIAYTFGTVVGGELQYGESFFGHPLGEVSISATDQTLSLTIEPMLGKLIVPNEKLAFLKGKYPGLTIFTSANQVGIPEVWNPETRDNSHILYIGFSNTHLESDGLPALTEVELRNALHEIVSIILDPKIDLAVQPN